MSWNAPYPAAPAGHFAPTLPPQALAGVRTRRIIAVIFDALFIGAIALGLYTVLGFATFGVAWLFLPPLLPLVAFFYNGFTIGGRGLGTWGMRLMDLEVRTTDGYQPTFLQAALQAVLYWLMFYFSAGFLLLWSLIAPDKRCLHDIFSGLIVVRRQS